MSDDKNIIPINRASIRALTELLSVLGKQAWNGPNKFNAIFVDNKRFMRQEYLPNPPPFRWDFVETPKMSIATSPAATVPDSCTLKRVSFEFYRRIGDTLEYREI